MRHELQRVMAGRCTDTIRRLTGRTWPALPSQAHIAATDTPA